MHIVKPAVPKTIASAKQTYETLELDINKAASQFERHAMQCRICCEDDGANLCSTGVKLIDIFRLAVSEQAALARRQDMVVVSKGKKKPPKKS